jgi:hypothetical protein
VVPDFSIAKFIGQQVVWNGRVVLPAVDRDVRQRHRVWQ